MCLFAIFISSGDKCLSPLSIFKLGFFFVLFLSFKSSLCILDMMSLSSFYFFAIIFSHHVSCSLNFLIIFFDAQVYNFDYVQSIVFLAGAFGVISKNPSLNLRSLRFMHKLSLSSFIVLAVIFRLWVHFELTFVYYER